MSVKRQILSLAAISAAAGVSLWFARGSLGLIAGADRPVRVAMLPSVVELGGLVVLGLLVGLSSATILRRLCRGADPGVETFLPLAAAALLALPYLPLISDWLPAFTVLAGPARWMLCGVILSQVLSLAAATVARSGTIRSWGPAPRPFALSLSKGERSGQTSAGPQARIGRLSVVLVFAGGLLIFGGAATRLARSPVFPGGDEPHYLILAQSLWRDGDFKIENNHRLGHYREYYVAGPLEPHYLGRGRDGEIYSVHPVGLPIVMAPVYAIGGYRGVVWVLAAMGAAAAALMWARARALSASAPAATFAWASLVLAAPYLFNAIAVYPEILAAVAVMLALTCFESTGRARAWFGCGLAVATLPWLSTKYAPMAGALAAVGLWRIRRHHRSIGVAVALIAPFAVSLLAWFVFFYAFWGSPSPAAPYAGYDQTRLLHLRVGGPGLLFDQEYGILPYAPIFAVAFTGLLSMWRAGGDSRTRAVEVALVGAALLGTVGAFRIWWGGDAAPGRPVASGLPLLALPIAWQFARAAGHPFRRAAYVVLMLAGAAMTAVMVLAQNGLLINNGRDGVSELLQWLSPEWRLWALAPSYIYHGPVVATGVAFVWIAAAAAAAAVLARLARRQRRAGTAPASPITGVAHLSATLTLAAAVVLVAVLVPALFGDRLQPPVRLEAQPRVRLLDDFDATRRPLALVYDPLRRIDPQSVPSLFTLEATPGLRRARQPMQLLFNARFALPAGEYAVELDPARAERPLAGALALQVGRIGNPVAGWPVQGTAWDTRFLLPLDANFVGFRASTELEQSTGRLRLLPRRLVDAHQRLKTPPVLAAAPYGASTVYFHDEQAWPEPTGFWTRGGATVPVTVILAPQHTLILNVHSGTRNHVALRTPTWQATLDLEPDTVHEVEVPAGRRPGVIPLHITSLGGFTPADTEAGSMDRRFLGCWIAPTTKVRMTNESTNQ